MRRRTFLGLSAASAIAAATACTRLPTATAARKSILVLGGTNYLGPAIVEQALARGHDVTLFNRGITRPGLFPDVEKLRGERHPEGGDLTALHGRRRFDAVVDVWPQQSALVEHSARLLSSRSDYYFFVSSIAVYRDFSAPGLVETAPTHQNDPGWYGGEKALAERAASTYFPGAAGICRCHAILGPRDDGAAYHYWLRRLATGQDVLAPGTGHDPIQYVDVRDVAAWIVDSVEARRNGTYNLTGPVEPMTLRGFLAGSRDAIGSAARLVWADADFLRNDHKVASFSDMPLWAPLDEDAGFYQIDGSKAVAAGIAYRPLADTARGAWGWYRSHFFREVSFPLGGLGLSPEREREILAAWYSRG